MPAAAGEAEMQTDEIEKTRAAKSIRKKEQGRRHDDALGVVVGGGEEGERYS